MANSIKTALRNVYFSKRFNKYAVRLYSIVHPPLYRRPNMEFDADVWNGICTFRSQQGRQIGENNTGPEIYKEVVETEHRICKFEGSRYGLPINVTALREVMATWEDALQFSTIARNDYIKRRKLCSDRFNLRQAYVLSKLGAAIPAYLARRKDNPLKNGSLLPLETTFFTLGVGPFMVVRSLMEKGDLTPLELEPLTAERMYELADSSGSIVSASGKGCAGSKKLFIDLLDVVMNGTYKKELTSTESMRVIASLGDLDRFYSYVYASSRVELLVRLMQFVCAQSLYELQDKSQALSGEEREWVQKSLAECYHKPANDLDDRTVMKNFIRVTLALLNELDYPSVETALVRADILRSDGSAPESLAGDVGQGAVKRISRGAEIIFPYIKSELDGVHQALGRYIGETITIDQLYKRCCGPQLKLLLDRLGR